MRDSVIFLDRAFWQLQKETVRTFVITVQDIFTGRALLLRYDETRSNGSQCISQSTTGVGGARLVSTIVASHWAPAGTPRRLPAAASRPWPAGLPAATLAIPEVRLHGPAFRQRAYLVPPPNDLPRRPGLDGIIYRGRRPPPVTANCLYRRTLTSTIGVSRSLAIDP